MVRELRNLPRDSDRHDAAMNEPSADTYASRMRETRLELEQNLPIRVLASGSSWRSGSRCEAIVGTSVRESRYDVSIANTTASASGVNRNRATPVSSTTGKNTMQMDRVPTRVGVGNLMGAVEDRNQQRLVHRVVAVDVLDFDGGIVDQHSDCKCDPAERHRVDASGR